MVESEPAWFRDRFINTPQLNGLHKRCGVADDSDRLRNLLGSGGAVLENMTIINYSSLGCNPVRRAGSQLSAGFRGDDQAGAVWSTKGDYGARESHCSAQYLLIPYLIVHL